MIRLPPRPTLVTVMPDGRVLHPCGCIDINAKPYVLCPGHVVLGRVFTR